MTAANVPVDVDVLREEIRRTYTDVAARSVRNWR
jgi:hypothetical protein